MRKLLLLCACALLLVPCAFSQTPQSWTSADIYLAIRKLNVLGSVLYVAAHPDDENTRLITYLSKDKLYRTGYLSMTRGDGGQNLIGDEQGIELGLIRTQELLAARRVDGGEQFFTRAYDFGYSKTPEETFTKWDKEKILSDVVWVIRKFQPDVIVTRFAAGPQPGNHGHHIASSILANEAFAAAADPNRFPEQLKYVQPWQAKRILLNTANFGGNNQTSNDQFKFDVGGYNPLLGKSYGEIAATSRSNHKSQGFGSAATRGETLEYFRTTGGTAPINDLMDDVDNSWKRVTGGGAISAIIDSLSSSFDLIHPEKSVKGLVRLYQSVNNLPDGYWRNKKLTEVQQLIEQCSGLFIDATTTEQFAVQTDSVKINFVFNNRLGTNTIVKKVKVDAFDSVMNQVLSKNKNQFFSKTLFVPSSKPVTQQYWLENKMETGYFNVTDQQKIGQADADAGYMADIILNIEGQDISFVKAVKYKFTDPVKGEIYWPLVITPPFTMKIAPELIFWVNKKGSELYTARYEKLFTSYKNNNKIRPGIAVKTAIGEMMGLRITDSIVVNKETKSMGASDTASVDYSHSPVDVLKGRIIKVTKPGSRQDEFFDRTTKHPVFTAFSIKYDHLPSITYFKPAIADFRNIDYLTYGKKIGYIVGAGDKVPEALEQMGYEVVLLTDKELSKNNFVQYDAIITGVRAYNTHDWMNKHYDKLMKYINDGGNLIVQYNTSNQIGPVRAKIGPYNFNITRARVTDENAKVAFLKPEHPAFNFPNKITDDDFKGWIQERSIYHASDTSGKFEKLISMNDPGETFDNGSLIVTKYGKGWFTYTGIVFFRELPAGVPGAYRLLANLIALNKKKGF
jgi:LmbE family N-acetylglucosaminyl deacetylase